MISDKDHPLYEMTTHESEVNILSAEDAIIRRPELATHMLTAYQQWCTYHEQWMSTMTISTSLISPLVLLCFEYHGRYFSELHKHSQQAINEASH
jgi:hypothetical protein